MAEAAQAPVLNLEIFNRLTPRQKVGVMVALALSVGAVVLTESAALYAFAGLLVLLGGAIVWLARRAERRT